MNRQNTNSQLRQNGNSNRNTAPYMSQQQPQQQYRSSNNPTQNSIQHTSNPNLNNSSMNSNLTNNPNGLPSTTRIHPQLEANNSAPLFSFDLNFDSLKKFLDSMTETINQHATLISSVQQELPSKQHVSVFPEYLAILGEGGRIMNDKLNELLTNAMASSVKPETTDNELLNLSNRVVNKMNTLGYAVAHNYAEAILIPPQLNSLNEKIDAGLKQVREDLRAKQKKLKHTVNQKFEVMQKELQKQLIDFEAKNNEKMRLQNDRIQENEKATVWRITQCEELLKTRITQEFVIDSCRLLEDKFKRIMAEQQQNDADRYERASEEMVQRMKNMEEILGDKTRHNKKLIVDLEDNMNQICAKKTPFEEFKRSTVDSIDLLNLRLKEIDFTMQVQPHIDRQNIHIQSIDEQVKDVQDNLSDRITDLTGFVNTIREEIYTILGKDPKLPKDMIDPHKLCELQEDLVQLTEDFKRQQVAIDTIEERVLNKLENIDLAVYDAGFSRKVDDLILPIQPQQSINLADSLSHQISSHRESQGNLAISIINELPQQNIMQNRKLSAIPTSKRSSLNLPIVDQIPPPLQTSNLNRKAVEEMIETMSQELMEVIEIKCKVSADPDFLKMTNEIRELNRKCENVRELEKRVSRIFKEVDLNGMARSMKLKAEKEDVLKDNAILDVRISSTSDQIAFCRKDIDNLVALYKKLLAAISANPTSDISQLITTKKLIPFNQLSCVSCGPKQPAPVQSPTYQVNNHFIDKTRTTTNSFSQQSKIKT